MFKILTSNHMSKRKHNDDVKNDKEDNNKNDISIEEPQIDYVFNIMYEDKMAQRCIDFYAPLCKNLQQCEKKTTNEDPELETILHDKLTMVLRKVVEDKLWDSIIVIDDPKEKQSHVLGDVVKVSYCPASQRYISHYEERGFTGRILFIDHESDNMFFLQIDDSTEKPIEIRSLETDGCHFFGMCRSYDYFIEKVDTQPAKKRKFQKK